MGNFEEGARRQGRLVPIPWSKSLVPARTPTLLAISVTVSLLLPPPGQPSLDWPAPDSPPAEVSTGPVQVRTSFSPRHANFLGLDWQHRERRRALDGCDPLRSLTGSYSL